MQEIGVKLGELQNKLGALSEGYVQFTLLVAGAVAGFRVSFLNGLREKFALDSDFHYFVLTETMKLENSIPVLAATAGGKGRLNVTEKLRSENYQSLTEAKQRRTLTQKLKRTWRDESGQNSPGPNAGLNSLGDSPVPRSPLTGPNLQVSQICNSMKSLENSVQGLQRRARGLDRILKAQSLSESSTTLNESQQREKYNKLHETYSKELESSVRAHSELQELRGKLNQQQTTHNKELPKLNDEHLGGISLNSEQPINRELDTLKLDYENAIRKLRETHENSQGALRKKDEENSELKLEIRELLEKEREAPATVEKLSRELEKLSRSHEEQDTRIEQLTDHLRLARNTTDELKIRLRILSEDSPIMTTLFSECFHELFKDFEAYIFIHINKLVEHLKWLTNRQDTIISQYIYSFNSYFDSKKKLFSKYSAEEIVNFMENNRKFSREQLETESREQQLTEENTKLTQLINTKANELNNLLTISTQLESELQKVNQKNEHLYKQYTKQKTQISNLKSTLSATLI